MAFVIEITQLSPTMNEGILVEWVKKEGDFVAPGDVIALIETDKAVMDLEAFEEGILLSQVAQASVRLSVGTPIGIIGEVGEDITDLIKKVEEGIASSLTSGDSSGSEIKPEKPIPAESSQTIQDSSKINQETKTSVSSSSSSDQKIQEIQQPSPKQTEEGRIKASPLAKKLASMWGISLHSVKGSGPGGRIVKKDVEEIRGTGGGVSSIYSEGVRSQDKRISLSMMRQSIAHRLTKSKSLVPHFYLTKKIKLDALMNLRKEVNADLSAYHNREEEYSFLRPAKLSVNDFIIRANALSLQENPDVNSQWDNDGIILKGNVDIGIAVAIEDGLITPVIRSASQKNIFQISLEIKNLAKKAQNRKLSVEEFTGGTFTISNLGMHDIDSFIAILNPPEAALMAVGKGVIEPYFDSGERKFSPQNVLSVTLSCDHRVVDGAKGAEYLKTFSFFMEHPRLLI